MAKPLDDRITAALGKDARAATVADLQRELATLIEQITAERDQHAATAISPTVDEATADAAADEVPKLERKITRLGAKADLLATRHQELMASEKRRDVLARYAEVKGRRDQLVADLKEQWPALTGKMIALLQRIEISDDECKRMGGVYGEPALQSAEAVVRGCHDNFFLSLGMTGSINIVRLGGNNIEQLDASNVQVASRPAWQAARFRQ